MTARRMWLPRGYNVGADRFAAWERQVTGSTRRERLEELLGLMPKRPDVLELGSGAGVRSTRLLVERSRLVGVDIPSEQGAGRASAYPPPPFFMRASRGSSSPRPRSTRSAPSTASTPVPARGW